MYNFCFSRLYLRQQGSLGIDEQLSWETNSKTANKKNRKYQDSYIKFGFTFEVEKSKHHPKCIICLTSGSMKPSRIEIYICDAGFSSNLNTQNYQKFILVLLPFASTYLWETVFSTLAIIKNKYRSRLNVEADWKVAVSNIEPNLESIMSSKWNISTFVISWNCRTFLLT